MKKIILYALPVVFFLAGCLQDNITNYQVVARPVYQPNAVYYLSITNTLNLEVLWNPPLSDTQQNFKGYYLLLYNSLPSSDLSATADSTFGPAIDSAHVPKIDTNFTFMNKDVRGGIVQSGRYTVWVYGERFPDPKKPDSLVLSQFYASLSFNFDSRPDSVPTQIFASSTGPTTINLFWTPSVSESNVGMAGYIIRYKDMGDNSAHVAYYTRIQTDSSPSLLIYGNYYTTVTLPGNTAPPFERGYTIWVKAIRKDSVESSDSIGITWSGAERFSLQATNDTGVFIGLSNFNYTMVQTDPNSNAAFQIMQTGNSYVIVGKNGTQFVNTVVTDTGLTLERNFLSKPYAASDFSQSQISFPLNGTNTGAIVYALFPTNNYVNRARLLFTQTQDTVSHLITNQIQASVQPISSPQLPFF